MLYAMSGDELEWCDGKSPYYWETKPALYTMCKCTVQGVDKYVLWRRETFMGVYPTPDKAAGAAQEDCDNIPM